eukprot:NODE_125_length_18781_cov_0.243015.p2 type:complete len:781 gc:universal NODE_125_length_18781_cov_0.243015:10997-13339(+)
MQKIPHFIGKPAPIGYVAGISRGAKGFTTEASVGRVAEASEKPDEEAIKIFDQIENKLKKRKRNEVSNSDLAPSLDIKNELVGMSMDDWNSIPEPKNISRKKKRKISETFSEVPDKLVLNDGLNALNQEQSFSDYLDKTSLKTVEDFGDIRKARDMLNSVVGSNQFSAPSWIALARIEEASKDIQKARQIILQGCEKCTGSEDIWLEAVRLHSLDKGKGILGQAVRFIPRSVEIWKKAAELETKIESKRLILRKAVERIPDSLELWKCVIDLETEPNTVIPLLKKAIDFIPSGIDFYLALYSLQHYDDAKTTLSTGRLKNPQNESIWLHSAYLEESNSQGPLVDSTITSFHKVVELDRSKWLQLALDSDLSKFPQTAKSIVDICVKNICDSDCQLASSCNCPTLTRYLYQLLSNRTDEPHLELYQKQFSLLSDDKDIEEFLVKSSREVQCDVLWLQYAKSRSNHVEALKILEKALNHIDTMEIYISICKIYALLQRYDEGLKFADIGISKFVKPRMYLKKAVLLKYKSKPIDFIQHCIDLFPKYFKFYLLLAECVMPDKQLQVLNRGIKVLNNDILYMHVGKVLERQGKMARSRAALERGRKHCNNSELLFQSQSRLEMRNKNQNLALQVLLRGLSLFPNSGRLWSEIIFVESSVKQKSMVIEALKRCPEDYLVFLACAHYYWRMEDYEKAREWFNKGVALNPKYGDGYITWYAFECSTGSPDHVAELALRSEPKYGELYTAYSKNWHNLSVVQILKEASKWIKSDELLQHTRIVDIFIE